MKTINVAEFIAKNYTEYRGDGSFLQGPTEKTKRLWEQTHNLLLEETRRGGVYDIDNQTVSTITSHAPGYINKELEQIVGLQTDAPLKRAIMPFGGIRMVRSSLKAYERPMDENVEKVFTYRKTHNDGVFDVYSEEMRKARHSGIITGLPDAYGRGRIIGDYRRVALYGVDYLIEQKQEEKVSYYESAMDEDTIRRIEETAEQIRALHELKAMAQSYGFDIGRKAEGLKEAAQWIYFGYLAAIKEQNGAAMSIGRISTFLDIYAEQELKAGTLTEAQVQEIVDHLVMKLRLVRFLRTPSYDALFSGDPTWVTESIAGMLDDTHSLVTKMSFRFLHTLRNLGPAPEPNLTVLYTPKLPDGFKKFCAQVSAETSAIQYESDDLMRAKFGSDYGIACCVSAMRIGKQMQFFGARANLAKALLYAINGGIDEVSGEQVGPKEAPLRGVLDYETVYTRFETMCEWLAKLYVNTLNVIHFMHDKYCYESLQMALHDKEVYRTLACGIAGLSVVADSLAAIKYAKVKTVEKDNIAVDFVVEGDFPKFGNNDERVDSIAVEVVRMFMSKLRQNIAYRNAVHTLSILTITSNVVYGKKTGSTPDGRKAGEPFAPGANPMHGRDTKGAVASMLSVAKLPYDDSEDGISYTFSIVPNALGKGNDEQTENLVNLMDGYFAEEGHHININVLNRDTLLDAMDHPEKYPQLTIRVSGYAVNFIKLTREQQLDVIHRTFHSRF
ncbi:MAG: formate C-acetyltransferase [Clostridia bacterium]|nr:formate C-acetyltransferase [Clostridia bacterium]